MRKQQLRDELKNAMLAKDTQKTSVLRMLLSDLTYFEIQKGGANYEASEEDVLAVLQRQVKQRKDSIEQFRRANRLDLAEKEEAELVLIQTYLPPQMSEGDIREAVKEAIAKTQATSLSDMGKVMGTLMPTLAGKADGGTISSIAKELLTKHP